MELRVSLSGEDAAISALDQFAGVAMIRGEIILRSREEYWTVPAAAEAVHRYLEATCSRFAGKPVWYRLADLWSDEVATLAGEPGTELEHNPIIGLRGTERMMRSGPAREVELGILSDLASRFGNLHVLAPFIHDAAEFAGFAEEMSVRRWPNRLGSMIEIPAAVVDAGAIVAAGASNLFVGLNDLTSLSLGRERGPPELKLHHAVWAAIDTVAAAAAGRAEWGVGGSLSAELLDRIEAAGAHYAALHYSELPELLGVERGQLPDAGFVREVKARTRAARARLAERRVS
jgi:phosphoenolpyruvate-protein kinase (PTS system EI component)